MKQFKALFMLLIGMISFTAMASTPLTEQKQKIEIVKDFHVQAVADNVLSFVSIQCSDFSIQSNDVHILRIVSKPFNILAIITDVGWRNYIMNHKEIPNKERLIDNQNYRNKLSKVIQEHRIRDNPQQ